MMNCYNEQFSTANFFAQKLIFCANINDNRYIILFYLIGVQCFTGLMVGGGEPTSSREKHTYIQILLEDLPMSGCRGTQHQLDLNSQ